jgi:hypothetical protein
MARTLVARSAAVRRPTPGEHFELPIRLGLANSGGTQDLGKRCTDRILA